MDAADAEITGQGKHVHGVALAGTAGTYAELGHEITFQEELLMGTYAPLASAGLQEAVRAVAICASRYCLVAMPSSRATRSPARRNMFMVPPDREQREPMPSSAMDAATKQYVDDATSPGHSMFPVVCTCGPA